MENFNIQQLKEHLKCQKKCERKRKLAGIAIVAAGIAAIVGVGYAIYKFFIKPKYEEFEDDFEEEFEDELLDDEEDLFEEDDFTHETEKAPETSENAGEEKTEE